MSTNFIVNSLPDYVQENKDLLVKNFALVGGDTRSRMAIQTGVKHSAHLNILDIEPTLQDGSDCGFNAQGDAILSQREIVCPSIKVDMDICPRKLVGKWAEYLVRNNATESTLPFEQYIMTAVTDEIVKKIEKLIWQGDTSKNDSNIKWFDGLLKIAGATEGVEKVGVTGESAYEDILAVYMALTEETLDRGAEIYVAPATFRSFLQELVAKNLYHYSAAVNDNPNEFVLPGTDTKVVRTPGLAGAETKILGTFPANLVYGCDLENDEEDIDLWWSQDDRVFKLEALWNSGVQIAYPGHVVLGEIQKG